MARYTPAPSKACLFAHFLPLAPQAACPAVALFTNDVRAVPAALMLARAAGVCLWQNVAFAIVTKVGGQGGWAGRVGRAGHLPLAVNLSIR
jgi:hypothetical protein